MSDGLRSGSIGVNCSGDSDRGGWKEGCTHRRRGTVFKNKIPDRYHAGHKDRERAEMEREVERERKEDEMNRKREKKKKERE